MRTCTLIYVLVLIYMFIYFSVVHVVMYLKTYVDKCKSIHPNKFRICFDHKNLWVCYLNIFIVLDTKWYILCQFLIQNKSVTTRKPHTKWGYHWGVWFLCWSYNNWYWFILYHCHLNDNSTICALSMWTAVSYYNELQFWMHILYWLEIYEILFTVHIKYKI